MSIKEIFFNIFILELDLYMYNNFLTYTLKPEKISLETGVILWKAVSS